jgi:hypothetical protein
MEIRILIFSLTVFLSSNVFSQTKELRCKTTSTVIEGIYQGKNLFFLNENGGIQNIFINKKEVSNKFGPSFELTLSDLKVGQKFKLKIIYCENPTLPFQIANPEAIK